MPRSGSDSCTKAEPVFRNTRLIATRWPVILNGLRPAVVGLVMLLLLILPQVHRIRGTERFRSRIVAAPIIVRALLR